MSLISSLTSMAANVWDYFSIPIDPLWKRALDEPGYREYLAFESAVRTNLKFVEEHISNKAILPQTLRTILLKQQDQLERFTSSYFYDKKLKRLQDKLNCPKAFIDVLEENRVRLKEKLGTNPLIAKQSFYNDVINHLIKLSANLDLHVINADDLTDVINYYQGIIPAEIFDPIKAAIKNNSIMDQKNIEAALKTVNVFFFGDKAKDKSSVISKQADQLRSRSVNLKSLAAVLAWSYVGAGINSMGVKAQPTGIEFLKVFGGNRSESASTIMSTASDRIIIGGSTYSFGAEDMTSFLEMFSANGSFVWALRFGGIFASWISQIKMTQTDEILVGGNIFRSPGRYDILLASFSLEGKFISGKSFGRTSSSQGMQGWSATPAGGIVVVANIRSSSTSLRDDVLVINFDSSDSLIWSRILGGDGNDNDGRAVVVNPITGKIIVLSDTESFGGGPSNRNILFTVFSGDGTFDCACTLGGNDNDYGIDIKLINGQPIVLGRTNSFGSGGEDILAASVFENCTVNWVRTYGREGSDTAQSMIVDPTTGNIMLLAGSNSFGQPSLLLKLFPDGMQDWAETFGTSGYYYSAFTMNSNDEIFTVGGTFDTPTQTNFVFSKISSNQNSSACGLVTPVNLTVMDWNNITVTNVTSLINITTPTISVYNWTNMTVQAITPEEYFSCSNNPSVSTTTPSNPTSLSNVPTSPQNPQTTTITTPSSSPNNPTSPTSSQTSNTINFTVLVSPEIIPINSDSIILSSEYLSIIGNVDPRTVIYTVRGDMPDWVSGIYVDGVFVTQFTQQDVEGGFVSIPLNGVVCEDDHTLSLEATVEGTDVKVDVDLIFEMSTCTSNKSSRLSDILFSAKLLSNIGLWARGQDRNKGCSEAEFGKGFPVFR